MFVLTFLDTNSNIYAVLDWFLLIGFSHKASYFWCLCMCGNFDWIVDIVNFTLLKAGYLCIFTNVLNLSSGMQLRYLQMF